MTVAQLIEALKKYNPDAIVQIPGQGYNTEAGTWIEGDHEEVNHVNGKHVFEGGEWVEKPEETTYVTLDPV